MKQIKRDKAGYTILVQDKYLLCGTSRDSYFKDLDNLGISNPRQYKSIKIVLNNVGNHLRHDFPEIKDLLIKKGYYKNTYWGKQVEYSPDAIKYLIKEKIIKIVKVSQILSFEEEIIL